MYPVLVTQSKDKQLPKMAALCTEGAIAAIIECFHKIHNESVPNPNPFCPKLQITGVNWIGHYVLKLSDGVDEIEAIMSNKLDEKKKLLRVVKGKIVGRRVGIELYTVCSKHGHPTIVIKKLRMYPMTKEKSKTVDITVN